MRTMIRWMFSNHLQGWNPFGRGPTFFWRLKDTILKRRAITNTATFKEGKDITIEYFYPYVVLTLKETFTAKYNGVLPRTPEVWPKSEIYTPKRDEEHPRPFHMGFPPGVETDGELGRVKKWSWRPRSIMHLCAFVEKKKGIQKDPQSLSVVFVIFLLCTKENRMRMCMFSFNRVKLQSLTSSFAWLFWERSAFLSASYSSSWSWNRDIQVLILGK